MAFILISMSANTLYHYFGDIREWNQAAKTAAAQLMATNPGMTMDVALDRLEQFRPTLNLWMTPADALASGHPKGMELWKLHVFGWLACVVLGTFIGLSRWASKKDAETAAAAAKASAAKLKAAGA